MRSVAAAAGARGDAAGHRGATSSSGAAATVAASVAHVHPHARHMHTQRQHSRLQRSDRRRERRALVRLAVRCFPSAAALPHSHVACAIPFGLILCLVVACEWLCRCSSLLARLGLCAAGRWTLLGGERAQRQRVRQSQRLHGQDERGEAGGESAAASMRGGQVERALESPAPPCMEGGGQPGTARAAGRARARGAPETASLQRASSSPSANCAIDGTDPHTSHPHALPRIASVRSIRSKQSCLQPPLLPLALLPPRPCARLAMP